VSVEYEVQDDCEVEEEHRMLQEEQDDYCSSENGLSDVNNDQNTCRKHSRQSDRVEDMSSQEEQDTDLSNSTLSDKDYSDDALCSKDLSTSISETVQLPQENLIKSISILL